LTTGAQQAAATRSRSRPPATFRLCRPFLRLLPFYRRPFQFLCPFCGCQFFWINAGLTRLPDRLPRVRLMKADLECTECGLVTDYDDFVKQHRGWLV
jgi:hypothetical protein